MTSDFDLPAVAERTGPTPLVGGIVAKHIRGSSLLLVGRMLALTLDFVAQVLMVHYLSKADYGSLGYALSIVALCQGVAMFQMSSTLPRFIPLYRERGQNDTMFGSIVLAFGVVLGLGLLIAAAIVAGLMLFGLRPTDDPQALRLLPIVALLVPVQGLDSLFTSLFATFGSSRAIFLRQSVLAPGLRIALVVILIALQANVTFLATGYLAAGLVGVVVYAWMFRGTIRDQGLLQYWHPRQFSYPARELFGFATPMLISTLVWLLMESSDALLLGYFKDTEAVASFRAVLPMAQLNQTVILAFTPLFTPLAARLYARREHAELSRLYRQTTLWMTVLSFPIFILTFSFARSITTGVYGLRYAESTPIMALLSLGYFFHTSLGFNGLTLKLFKKLRYIVSINVAAAILNIAINLLLIPRWGALGAAAGTTVTLIIHNLLKQFGLRKYTGMTLFHQGYVLPYVALFGVPLALLGLQAILPASVWIALGLGGVASLSVLWSSRAVLQIDTMFPELRRWPIVRAILRPLLGPS